MSTNTQRFNSIEHEQNTVGGVSKIHIATAAVDEADVYIRMEGLLANNFCYGFITEEQGWELVDALIKILENPKEKHD